MNAAEHWAVDTSALLKLDLEKAVERVQTIPEDTFKTTHGPVDPVYGLQALINVLHANRELFEDDVDLNDFEYAKDTGYQNLCSLLLVANAKHAELAPSLQSFVGLHEITAVWSGGVLGIDGTLYRFYADTTYLRGTRNSWLRTIRKLSTDQANTADLVAVIKIKQRRVCEFRLHGAIDGDEVLYAVDESTGLIIFKAGTITERTFKVEQGPVSRFVFEYNEELPGLEHPAEIETFDSPSNVG